MSPFDGLITILDFFIILYDREVEDDIQKHVQDRILDDRRDLEFKLDEVSS